MVKKSRFVLFIAMIFLASAQSLFALDSSDIETVRISVGTGKLSSSDVLVVNDFASEAISEMLLAEDISQISLIRRSISQQKGTSLSQYSIEFIKAIRKNIKASFGKAATLQEGSRRSNLELNLLILAAEMQSIKMADFGLDMVDSQNAAIQYWAVRTIASPQIALQLTARATSDPELKKRIADVLAECINRGIHPTSLSTILKFARVLGANDPQGSPLIHQIAAKRIEQYQNWTVKYELLDRDLLNMLTTCTFKAGSATKRGQCAATFGQLFSYVMQRYILGQEILSQSSKQQLSSVMIEIEKSAFGPGKFLDRPQVAIKQALTRNKIEQLRREYETLFGSRNRIGRLAASLKFDYRDNADGNQINIPKKLELPKTNE